MGSGLLAVNVPWLPALPLTGVDNPNEEHVGNTLVCRAELSGTLCW